MPRSSTYKFHSKIYKTSPFEVPQRKLSSFVCPFSRNKPLLLSIQNGWIVTFIQLLALLFFRPSLQRTHTRNISISHRVVPSYRWKANDRWKESSVEKFVSTLSAVFPGPPASILVTKCREDGVGSMPPPSML